MEIQKNIKLLIQEGIKAQLIIWIILGVVLFLVAFLPFIIGKYLFVYKGLGADSLWSYWPLHYYSLELLRSIGKSGWAWKLGMGTNVFAIQSFLLDPFNLILILFSAEILPIGLLIITLIKLSLAGILFYRCLRHRNFSIHASSLAALIFTFNGYAMLWSCQDTILTAYLLTIAILYGYERYRFSNNPIMLTISTALLAMVSPYYLWMAFLFMGTYLLVDCLSSMSLRDAFHYILKVSGWTACGIALAAVAFFPGCYVLLTNPRVSGMILPSLKSASLYEYAAFILRGMSINGIGAQYIPVSPFSGPLWSTSLLALVSLPQLLKKPLRTPRVIVAITVTFLAVIFLHVTIPVFNGFSQETYRWSWLLIIPILMGAGKVWTYWEQKKELSQKLAWIGWGTVCTLWLVCLYYVITIKKINLYDISNRQMVYANIIVALVLMGLGVLLALKPYCSKRLFSILIISLVVVEIGTSSVQIIWTRAPIKPQERLTTYFDGSREAVEVISKLEGNEFYRVDKDYNSVFLDDAPIQGYMGVKSYVSSNNPAYFKFSQVMDANPTYNFIYGFDGRPQIQTLLGVKYLLSRKSNEKPGFELINNVGNIYIFRNINPLPIGFVYGSRMTEDVFVKLEKDQKESALLQAVIVPNEVAKELPLLDSKNLSLNSINNIIMKLTSEPFNITSWSGNKVTGEVDAGKGGVLFFSIPFDKGWSALVDGQHYGILRVNIGFSGLELGPGKHMIQLHYTPPGLYEGMIISILTVIALFVRMLFLRMSSFSGSRLVSSTKFVK